MSDLEDHPGFPGHLIHGQILTVCPALVLLVFGLGAPLLVGVLLEDGDAAQLRTRKSKAEHISKRNIRRKCRGVPGVAWCACEEDGQMRSAAAAAAVMAALVVDC